MSDQSNAGPRRLVIIDGANAMFRAFFAIPNLRAPDGTPTNAVYGIVSMLGKVMREESPDTIIVAMDPRGGSFRKRIFEGYKATRESAPEDLIAQFPVIREAIEAFGVPLIEVEDFEADDVIAALVEAAPEQCEIGIVSTDKDLMQLVTDRVTLLDHVKNLRYGPAEVEERFGVPPEKILDMRSLVGDSSDNIPGVKGIGEKGAAKLIKEWGSLESLLDHAVDVKAKRAREALQEQRDQAILSKELSTLRSDVPLPSALDELAYDGPDIERLRELYQRLGFNRLIASLDELAQEGTDAPASAAVAAFDVETLTTKAALATALDALVDERPLVMHLLCGEGSAVDAKAVGLGLARPDAGAYYVPFVGDGLEADSGLAAADCCDALGARFGAGDPTSHAWSAANTKQVQSVLGELGLSLPAPCDDLQVAAFLLDPAGAHHASALSAAMLGRDIDGWEEVAGRGAKAVAAEALPVETAARWVGEQVAAVRELLPAIRERLAADGVITLYEDVELPLTSVLSRMERAGFRVDEEMLSELADEYETSLAQIEKEIYALAGEEFLISSPKQLQVILFEKLSLPAVKKTKTGYSTAEGVLEQLQSHHALPGKILAYRKLSKLMSTYIEALPKLVCESTGRIHPHFNQLGAATGRMSANHPNVQNIPIREDAGARIREAFVPAEGCVLLSADYSQVELRILAHYSGDESLLDAFRKAEDIHRRTAAEVWGVALEDVSADQRARAKAVNFGIIYGSSAFGLANQLGIAAGEAQETIDAYFERYGGVRRFIEETIAGAKKQGFVTTMLGRRRYLPDVNSRNRTLRQAAERMAVNTVIQGTAADLIKKAMVTLDRALCEASSDVKMILQVHDELVFELAESDVPALEKQLESHMTGALQLDVPLVIDTGVGPNWREAH